MKTLLRIIQFTLSQIAEIFSSLWLTLMLAGLYIALPILGIGAFLVIIYSGDWVGIRYILILTLLVCTIFFISKFIPSFLNFIAGILLNERKENEKICKEYEKWYEDIKQKEYERRKKFQEEYQKQQQYWKEKYHQWQYQEYSNQNGNGNSSHFAFENTNYGGIIEKFEKYLLIFGIDKNGEINERIIKKAYKTKMIEVHPDRNSNKDTTSEAQKINEINEFLKEQLEYYLKQRRKRQ